TKDERKMPSRVEGVENAVEARERVPRVLVACRKVVGELARARELEPLAHATATKLAADLADRDAEQERAVRPRIFERVQLAKEDGECVLHEVFDFCARPERPHDETAHHR